MSIAKPYTFTAGTKARANEVNADFDTLYTQVNTNISDIADNASDIEDLEANKANINGSTSQTFSVANPSSNYHAVNKQSLNTALGNMLNYIDGLGITKDSSSPDDTIIVSPGSAYDSTKAICLTLSSSTTKQNENQGASTTYYVYIIGNATGSSIDILISTSSTTPTLPSGYTLYRKIGYFTTDSSSKIASITSLSNSIALSIYPDYSNATTISLSSGNAVGFDGWLNVTHGGFGVYNTTPYVKINNVTVSQYAAGGDNAGEGADACLVLVKSTDIITYYTGGMTITFKKIPFRS